jgi:tetratricopeptide (TPR) repeat protein
VSSTIGECASERAIARKAISSLNHEPVLFEDIGARPYPPRDVYKPRLEAAHFFVAICRESYGWVAPDMSISGIEDEFHIASDHGIDRLVYVLRPAQNRDPRLVSLLEKAKSSTTVAFYSEPDELYDRIRDDLTSVIAGRFAGQAIAEPEPTEPADVLRALVPEASHLIRRRDVEEAFLERLSDGNRVPLSGPFGSGKSVLLAQLSLDRAWVLINARGLTELETVARCANGLRVQGKRPAGAYTNIQAARAALFEAWEQLNQVTLVVDGVDDAPVLWDLLPPAKCSQSHQLIVSPRLEIAVAREFKFTLPPWSIAHVRELMTSIRGQPPSLAELRDVMRKSEGSPLYVRFYAGMPSGDKSGSLKELELRALQALEPLADEASTYLALAGRALTLIDLQELLGDPGQRVDQIAEMVNRNSLLLRQTRGAVDLVHEHLRITIAEQLDETTARRDFLGSRLAIYLNRNGDYLTAFLVTKKTGEQSPSVELTERAAFQVSLRGGGKLAIPVLEERLAQARLWEDHERETMSLIAMAQVYRQLGQSARAREALSEASAAAQASRDPYLDLRVTETRLEFEVPHGGGISEFLALRQQYVESGRSFDAARISLQLSVVYIEGSQYEEAVSVLEEPLNVFAGLGDQYGIRLAKLNLAAALSGLPNSSTEALSAAQEVSELIDSGSQPRERAMVCNLLTRRYRDLDRPELAETFAREAIAIGEALGDQRIVALNLINLGNTYRDRLLLTDAETQYRLADGIANAASLPRIEASANELISSVLNERSDFQLAKVYAQHAAALARTSNDSSTESRAHEEYANSLGSLGDVEGAVAAYTEAAVAIARIRPEQREFVGLLARALTVANQNSRPDLAAGSLLSAFAQEPHAQPLQAMCDVMPDVASLLRPRDLVPISALAFSSVLESVAPEIERQVVLRVLRQLVDRADVAGEQLAAAIVGVLLACDWRRLALTDLVDIADRLATNIPGLYFKPQPDGAAHLTLKLPLAQGVICTISQLDDDAWVASASLLVALLFHVLSTPLRETVISANHLPRSEFEVNIVSQADFKQHVGADLSGLGEALESKFVLMRATDLTDESPPPTVVICREDLSERWHPEADPVSEIHILFASLIEVVASHLLSEEIAPELLHPKLGAVMRQISSLMV